MSERIIFRHDSKTLSICNQVRIFEGEKNVDYLELLIPEKYNDINLLECDIRLVCVNSDNKQFDILINDYKQDELYKSLVVFLIPIDDRFTSTAGDLALYLKFTNKIDEKDIILATSTATINIGNHPNGTNEDIEAKKDIIDEILLRSKETMEIAQSIREDADNAEQYAKETEKHAEATQKAAEETQKSAEAISEELAGIRYLIIGEAEEVDF